MRRSNADSRSRPGDPEQTARQVRSSLTLVWLTFRLPAAAVTSAIALVLAVIWHWPGALIVSSLGALAAVDAWRRRRSGHANPLVPLLIDTTLIMLGIAVIHVPDSAMGLPYAYTVVATLLMLPVLRALPVLVYGGALFLVVQREAFPFEQILTDSQMFVVGFLADAIFFVLLTALVVLASRELIAETARAEAAATHEQAIAACSTALLSRQDEDALSVALQSILGPTGADTAFVEVNEHREGVGLCTRLLREVDRDGAIGGDDDANPIPWTRMRTAYDVLSAGAPFSFLVDDLPAVERSLYAGSEIAAEVDVPVVADDTWLGVVGFTSREPRQWTDQERRLLTTGAEMIGSYWARHDARSQLEGSVSQLEQRAAYQSALADCAEILLGSQHEGDRRKALEALMVATDADFVYIDENYQDPRRGLCTKITDSYERPGSRVESVDEWRGGPYVELPTAFASLSRGEPVHIVTSLLEGDEQELYRRDGIKAELCVPINVRDAWVGSISFCDYQVERHWTVHELATLQNAARMFGSFIERRDATRELEAAVTALDVKLVHEAALSSCSEALLRGSDEAALQTALNTMVEATDAHKAFIDENFTDATGGVCARVTHEAIRPGYEDIVDEEIWYDEARDEMVHTVTDYREIPSVLERLQQGLPAIVDVGQLNGAERDFYEVDGCTGEVNIPILIGSNWVGSIGLALYERTPDWSDDVLRMLTTAAGMIAAFWERNRAHLQLEGLVASKDELIASVSHELRTPLTATLGLADYLTETNSTRLDTESTELLDIISQNSLEMAHIVDDLLTAARSDINTLVVAPEIIDVQEVVISVSRDKHPALGEAFPAVVVEGSATKAWADPSRVRQIVRNLLVNAAKYGGPRVWVVITSSGDGVSVAVCDDGTGVPPDSERAIFEAFQRAHDQPSQPASLGLGLTVSRRLARLMGGELEYRRMPSETAFVLTLPKPGA